MKVLAFVLIFLPSLVLAEGRLTTKYSIFNTSVDSYYASTPELGLWVNEVIKKGVLSSNSVNLEYLSWSGINFNRWVVSEHFLVVAKENKVKIGLGPAYGKSLHKDSVMDNFSVKAMVEVQLWK